MPTERWANSQGLDVNQQCPSIVSQSLMLSSEYPGLYKRPHGFPRPNIAVRRPTSAFVHDSRTQTQHSGTKLCGSIETRLTAGTKTLDGNSEVLKSTSTSRSTHSCRGVELGSNEQASYHAPNFYFPHGRKSWNSSGSTLYPSAMGGLRSAFIDHTHYFPANTFEEATMPAPARRKREKRVGHSKGTSDSTLLSRGANTKPTSIQRPSSSVDLNEILMTKMRTIVMKTADRFQFTGSQRSELVGIADGFRNTFLQSEFGMRHPTYAALSCLLNFPRTDEVIVTPVDASNEWTSTRAVGGTVGKDVAEPSEMRSRCTSPAAAKIDDTRPSQQHALAPHQQTQSLHLLTEQRRVCAKNRCYPSKRRLPKSPLRRRQKDSATATATLLTVAELRRDRSVNIRTSRSPSLKATGQECAPAVQGLEEAQGINIDVFRLSVTDTALDKHLTAQRNAITDLKKLGLIPATL